MDERKNAVFERFSRPGGGCQWTNNLQLHHHIPVKCLFSPLVHLFLPPLPFLFLLFPQLNFFYINIFSSHLEVMSHRAAESRWASGAEGALHISICILASFTPFTGESVAVLCGVPASCWAQRKIPQVTHCFAKVLRRTEVKVRRALQSELYGNVSDAGRKTRRKSRGEEGRTSFP